MPVRPVPIWVSEPWIGGGRGTERERRGEVKRASRYTRGGSGPELDYSQ